MKTIKAVAAAVTIMFAANTAAADNFVKTPMTDENAACFMMRLPVAEAANIFFKKAHADKKAWIDFEWHIAKAAIDDPMAHMGLTAAFIVGVYHFEDGINNPRDLTVKFFNECVKDPVVLERAEEVAAKMAMQAAEEAIFNE